MKTQIKIFKLLIFTLGFIIYLQGNVFANDLTLSITTDKDTYKIGDTIETTVDWKEKMQASSFKVGYDSDKLEFVSANINETFYNNKNEGEISINWVSFEENDLTQIKIQFKVLKTGETTIKINEVSAFADGNLVTPTSYDILTNGSKTITVESKDETSTTSPQEPSKSEKVDDNSKPNDNTTVQTPLPKTGVKTTIITTLFIAVILTAIAFFKNKKYSDI